MQLFYWKNLEMNKKTLVIGASTNPARYSNMAIKALLKNGCDVIALAKREGQVESVKIQTEFPANNLVHTVTMYVGEHHQHEYYQSILDLKPERVIFNPGTENYEFIEMLESKGIETIEGCTLVMLGTGQY
jgi:predicted CoA-binding protein